MVLFQRYISDKNTFLSNKVDDQTKRFVQSDLDLHCPQKVAEPCQAAKRSY